MHDIAEFLVEHEPFGGLDRATLDELARRVEVEFFGAGTTIFQQGEQAQEKVRVIRKGAVELVDHGRVLDLLGEGELFGHPSMVSGLPTGFEARPREDTLLCAPGGGRAAVAGAPRGPALPRAVTARAPEAGPVIAADVSGFDLAQQPVRALIRDQPIICEPGVSIREAARRMADAGASSVMVRLDDGELGIVTDQDLRSRVVAEGRSVADAIGLVMTAPAVSVGPDQNGSDVLLKMLDQGIRHLPVLSARGEVLGVVSDVDLLAARRGPRSCSGGRSQTRETIDELRGGARRLTPTLIGLHQADLAPAQISAVISVVLDALVRRTIELATAAAGPRPTEFAWLSLGSHGRREAVPSSDIDSGMVWADSDGPDPAPYMHAIAREANEMLVATGWRPDTHEVTASGSIFANSATDWRRTIRSWLAHPAADQVAVALSIVIDSRTAYGPENAFNALDELGAIHDRPAVLKLLLRLALGSKPPTGFLRDIVVEHSGEHRGSFDIKRGGLLPIIDIARYASVSAGAMVRSTSERLQAAAAAGKLREEEARSLGEAYELFVALRLDHQVQQLEAGVRPDDHLEATALSPLARRYLREAFRAVASVQKALA